LDNSEIEYEDENTNNNIPIKYSNSNDSLFSINKRINDINELSEKYNWGIKPNAMKFTSNKSEEPSMKEPSFHPSKKSSLQNKFKSYSSDSYSSRFGGKNDQELPPRKYENNYILGTNIHERRSSYSNSEATSSPYLKDSPYLSSNKKILYGDDYDNISNPKKKYSSKNLMFDTEELGKELDNLLDHIRTTRNNTTYGLFDKKYKYSKSYSYGHSSLGKDPYSSPGTNSVGGNQEYASKGYSSLSSSSKPYYSQSYLMNNDRDSKYDSYNYTPSGSGSGISFSKMPYTTDSSLKYFDEPLHSTKRPSYNTSDIPPKLNDNLYSLNSYNLNQSQALSLTNKSEALLQEHRTWLKSFIEKNNNLMN